MLIVLHCTVHCTSRLHSKRASAGAGLTNLALQPPACTFGSLGADVVIELTGVAPKSALSRQFGRFSYQWLVKGPEPMTVHYSLQLKLTEAPTELVITVAPITDFGFAWCSFDFEFAS